MLNNNQCLSIIDRFINAKENNKNLLYYDGGLGYNTVLGFSFEVKNTCDFIVQHKMYVGDNTGRIYECLFVYSNIDNFYTLEKIDWKK